MELFFSLWLPIVVAAFAVWIYSTLAWTALPIHAKDFKRLPDDDKVMDFVRALGTPPGVYLFPGAMGHKEGQTPEMKAKCDRGPMGTLSVWAKPNMGFNIAMTFALLLLATTLIGYLSAAGLSRGASFGKVMQVAGTAGVLTFSFSALPGMLWFQVNRNAVLSHLFDGVVMGLITGAVFGLLWPR